MLFTGSRTYDWMTVGGTEWQGETKQQSGTEMIKRRAVMNQIKGGRVEALWWLNFEKDCVASIRWAWRYRGHLFELRKEWSIYSWMIDWKMRLSGVDVKEIDRGMGRGIE
jgi:hypothetical protein